MKRILNAVMPRLKEQVTDLRYIAEDWGQLDYSNDAPPVKFPCALVSVSNVKFESQTMERRYASMTILIRVADAPLVCGTMAAPEAYRERAFAIFDVMDEIGRCLYAFGGEEFNEIEQQSITHYSREDAIREYAMTFDTEYCVEYSE